MRPTRILVGARGVNKTSWFWPPPPVPAARLVLFFGGDSVDAADAHPDVLRLSTPAAQAAAASARWPDALIVVVTPSRFEGGWAAYDRFLPGTTRSGEPTSAAPAGLPALSQAASLLAAGGWPARDAEEAAARSAPVPSPAAGAGWAVGGVGGDGGRPSAPPPATDRPWPPTTLVGFSKGGTVVSQALAELGSLGRGDATPALHPAALPLASSIDRLLYVDSGLNCRGSHCTDPAVAAGVAASPGGAPALEIHGTSRQWRDARRPWLAEEAARCERLFREAGVADVTRVDHGALGGGLGSHFRSIEAAMKGVE